MAARAYKRPRPREGEGPRPRRARRRDSGFFWFVTGAVVGAFGVGLAWTLQDQSLPPPAASSPQVQAKPTTEPRFIFHRLLPELEVSVPDKELSDTAPPPSRSSPKSRQTAKTEKPRGSAGDGTSYLVQVASLRKASDAEQFKARLALLGIRTSIQRVTINGKDYHRVRAGPYRDKREMNKTRALLSSNGLDSIAVKLK